MRMYKALATAFLAILMFVGATVPAAAQDAGDDIQGIEKAYSRSFTFDTASIMETENPDEGQTAWFLLTTMVAQFDTEEHADAAVELMMGEASGIELEDVELDLDLDYVARQAVQEQDGDTSSLIQVIAHDGEYVYGVVGVTFGDDPVDAAEAVITMIRDADVSDDDEFFNEDGASEGGLWAKLPSGEDITGEVENMFRLKDAILYPKQEGTPVA